MWRRVCTTFWTPIWTSGGVPRCLLRRSSSEVSHAGFYAAFITMPDSEHMRKTVKKRSEQNVKTQTKRQKATLKSKAGKASEHILPDQMALALFTKARGP